MFKPYPHTHNILKPLNGLADLKQRLLFYRIQICGILAFCIVSFAVFGLPRDEHLMKSPINDNDNNNNTITMLDSNTLTSNYIPEINNLIILPCHSIFAPELNDNDINKDQISFIEDPNNWLLESFQLESNDHISFINHIQLSFNELHKTIYDSVLVISGGYTKKLIKKSESSSYYNVALKSGILKNPYFKLNKNIFLEEYARDSYENVLFSLATFYKNFNKFPQKITIIGFGFKKERFLSSHLSTIGYYFLPNIINDQLDFNNLPDNNNHAKYISSGPIISNNDIDNDNYWQNLYNNEKKNALDLFKLNPFGSKNSLLNNKKLKRDPWNKHNEVFNFYKSNNETLNSLIEIENYEINDAWNIYQKKVMPNLPLFEMNNN
ncbi:hypothetical protein C6P40_002675 [Pichia californica]|uniref:Uncharacterized protein n=1 Tax=Pichia californica TaxID=460514 RepID=A0A9P6WQ74_9ASCO|nr:hypothetical protein C6P40_002675 [[Candida] californica]